MTEKTQVFNNRDEWHNAYGKDTTHHKYYVDVPSSYPCIGIEMTRATGHLGMATSVQVYVYLADFVKSP
jgi:hypothetical protein